jgi:hypothetical protein
MTTKMDVTTLSEAPNDDAPDVGTAVGSTLPEELMGGEPKETEGPVGVGLDKKESLPELREEQIKIHPESSNARTYDSTLPLMLTLAVVLKTVETVVEVGVPMIVLVLGFELVVVNFVVFEELSGTDM